MFIGFKMAFATVDLIYVVLSLIIGTVLGYKIGLEDRINEVLENITYRYFPDNKDFHGFIVASTLFCVGSMTIIGSIKDGLYNDGIIIKTKSIMDGFAAILLASKYGISVIFSAISVFVIQGLLTLFSKYLTFMMSSRLMGNIDGVGGLIILSIGLNLLKIKEFKTLNMLPSLVIIIFLGKWLH